VTTTGGGGGVVTGGGVVAGGAGAGGAGVAGAVGVSLGPAAGDCVTTGFASVAVGALLGVALLELAAAGAALSSSSPADWSAEL
jgi:hypothetical protein